MNYFDASDRLIKKNGRGRIVDGSFPVYTTGAGIEASVRASEAYAVLEADYGVFEPWISVLVDGARIQKLPLQRGENRIQLFRLMNPEEAKHIRISKDTQAIPDDDRHYVVFKGIETDGILEELPGNRLKLEFIGDSITSGEGLSGPLSLNDWVSFCFDSIDNYTNIAALNLSADYRVISQSGWGVGCGWNNDFNCTLPSIYEQYCGSCRALKDRFGSLDKNDFSGYRPDFIIVNLGTNDCGGLDQPEFIDPVSGKSFKNRRNPDGSIEAETSKRFKNNVLDFLKMLRKNNPDSKILWIYGIIGDDLINEIKAAVEEFNLGDTIGAEFIKLPEMTKEQTGARNHPGKAAHGMMAEIVCEAIRTSKL